MKTSAKFILNVVDVQHEERWYQKEVRLSVALSTD
jgi:hypothetical protein